MNKARINGFNQLTYQERLRRYDAEKQSMYVRYANEPYHVIEAELHRLIEKWKI